MVCSNALSARTATRYLAPYISHDCVAPVTITSTLSATVLQKYIRSYSPASFWITGPDLSELPVLLSGYYLWCYRFSVPVIQAIPAAECDWPALLKTFSRVSRTGPDSPQPAAPLYAWYACAPDTFLIETLKDGRATADLAYVSPDSLSAARARVRNSALIRLLRFWESGITNYSLETYAPMAEFMSRTCGPDDAAAGRCAVLFSAFLSRAVALSNYTWGTRILHDARRIYPSDPSLLRLAAKMEMTRSKPDISRAVHYNMQACAAYTNQYNRPYFDAWFAAILLERQLYDISYITNQFQLLKKSARAQYEKALASGASEQWINQCLFWEAQCNAYISNILRDGRQYIAAAEWEKHNLDERFPLKRRQPARERLIQLYEAGKNYQALFSMYDECAAAATSGFERLSWLLESANQYITLDMPVRAFEYYERANACLAGLPHEQRDVRATDSRYQRLLRYIEKQLQTDIREPVIATLLERAGANFDNGGWYYIQAAQLYRCRLEYQKAADVFSLGMKAYPAYAPVFIQGAFLQFQLSRYDKAINIFSNLVKYTAANTNTVTTQTDWRYRILTLLDRDRIPPELDAVNAWADQHVSAFSSTGAYYNYRANVLAQFGEFDQATNIFYQGISLDPRFLDNYLDLGYQLCRRSDAAKTGALIDRIQQLHLPEQTRLTIDTDWRFIELHHVSVRPFVLQE